MMPTMPSTSPAPLNGGAGPGLVEQATGFAEALDRLLPRGSTQIVDEEGRAYDLPAKVAARKALGAARILREAASGLPLASLMGKGWQEALGDLLDAVFADDALTDAVDRAFAVLLPGPLAAMRATSGIPDARASDLCDLSDMVGAMTPFFSRPFRQLLAWFSGIQAGTGAMQAVQPVAAPAPPAADLPSA